MTAPDDERMDTPLGGIVIRDCTIGPGEPNLVAQDGPTTRLIAKIRDELDHAHFNGHRIAGQGVGPFEKVPGVRVDHIEAAIEGFMRAEGWIK